jgi:hypothetical protein
VTGGAPRWREDHEAAKTTKAFFGVFKKIFRGLRGFAAFVPREALPSLPFQGSAIAHFGMMLK